MTSERKKQIDFLYLDGGEVARFAEPADVLAAVREVLAAHGRGETQMPPKVYLDFPSGDLRTMPAFLPRWKDAPNGIAAVKLVSSHPGNPARGLPAVVALTALYDPETGTPTALLDATYLTALRTGAAAAVATDLLARKDAATLGIFGAGGQCFAQVRTAALVRDFREVLVTDLDAARAEAAARRIADELGLRARAASAEETSACDVVHTVTPSTRPFLRRVRPGAHVNAVGADAPGKQEIDLDLVLSARVFVDDFRQAAHSGEIQHAVRAGRLSEGDVTPLGAVVARLAEGRRSDDEITLFDTTGLAVFDAAAAAEVVSRARAAGAGRSLSLAVVA